MDEVVAGHISTEPLTILISMATSVLDSLGEEVTGIVAPVSICMLLTVLLVRVLNPDGASNSSAIYIATAFYKEQVAFSRGGVAPARECKCSHNQLLHRLATQRASSLRARC